MSRWAEITATVKVSVLLEDDDDLEIGRETVVTQLPIHNDYWFTVEDVVVTDAYEMEG